MINVAGKDYMTRVEAAEYLGISVQTLAQWGFYKRPPTYIKPALEALYLKSDLDAYIESTRRCGGVNASK